MSRRRDRPRLPHGGSGFTVIETVIATALLGVLTIFVLGALLFGMTQAHGGQNRAAAASWAPRTTT